MATLINADGTTAEVHPASEHFTLQELQAFVGGYIEVIRVGSALYVLNEEGKILGLPPNMRATHRAHGFLFSGDFLCGNVLICEPHELD